MVEAKVRQPERARVQLPPQILLSFHFPLFPRAVPSTLSPWMPQAGVPQAGSRAGPGPQRDGLFSDRRGDPAREAAQRLAEALPRPGSPAPRLARPQSPKSH